MHSNGLQALAIAGELALIIFLGVYHQPYYPSTWIDEGFVQQGAINLVDYGQYAMRSSEGFRVLDQPLIANGPGVVLPVAAAFALLGQGLLEARLVIVFYLIVAVFLFWGLVKKLFGTRAALISTFFLLAVPGEGMIYYGRQALGNIPALAYFLAGYGVFLLAIKRSHWLVELAAGFLFGLAMITKGQYLILLPVLGVVAALDGVYYRQIGLIKLGRVFGAVVLTVGLWYLAQLLMLGSQGFFQELAAVRSSSAVTILTFSTTGISDSVSYLLHSGFWLLVLPGWAYAAWSCRQRSEFSVSLLLPVVFVAGWSVWFVFLSIGWSRYAFDSYMVGLLFNGYFAVNLIDWASKKLMNEGKSRGTLLAAGAASFFLIATLLAGVYSFSGEVRQILAAPDKTPQEFAQYLRANLSPKVVIEFLGVANRRNGPRT